MRDDPGGFVDATVEISSQFLEDGAVFWEEDADGTQVAVDVIDDGLATDPELELVRPGQRRLGLGQRDPRRGPAGRRHGPQLVGEPTFGKGTVQEWSELPGRERRLPPVGGQVADPRQDLDRW